MMALWLVLAPVHAGGVLSGLPSVVGNGEHQPILHAQPAGDLDGDGFGDMVFGAPYDDTIAGHESGRVWVLSGADISAVGQWSLVHEIAVGLDGEAAQDHAGYDIAAVGDVDGDGLVDLTVGAPDASAAGQPTAGKVYLVQGRTRFVDGSLGDEDQFYGSAHLTHLGARVYPAGDLDGDGLSELLLGAPWPTPNGTPGPGWVALFYGQESGWSQPQPVSVDSAPGGGETTADAVFMLAESASYAGRSAAVLPDPLGDGWPRLLLGIPGTTDPLSDHHHDSSVAPPPPHEDEGLPESGAGHHHTSDHGAAYLLGVPGLEDGPFVSPDSAVGAVFGEAAGDMLPWAMAGLSGGRAVLASPDHEEGRGGVWLLSSLGQTQSVSDADLAWEGDQVGDLLGWSVAAVEGLGTDGIVALGSPGWQGGVGRVSLVNDQGGAIEDAAELHLEGCLEDGLAGWSVRSHPGPDPYGNMEAWAGITAPNASVFGDRDGVAYVLTAADLDQLDEDCSFFEDAATDEDSDGFSSEEDCDDTVAWVYPGALEVCGNGVDEDCDGDVDEDCGPAGDAGCSTASARASLWLLLIPLIWSRSRKSAALCVLVLPTTAQASEPIALIWGSASGEYLQGPMVSGDFNGDGAMDLAIANHRGFTIDYAAGEVFLISGSDLTGEIDLQGWPDVVYGESEHDYLGRSLEVFPGESSDGLLIGQTFGGLTAAEQGELLVVQGPLLDGVPRGGSESAAVLVGDAKEDWFGEQVVRAGDLDGDGFEDVAASAPARDRGEAKTAGAVWIFHDDLSLEGGRLVVPQVATARIDGPPGGQTGWRLLAPGDVDGDGRDDLVVGMLDSPEFSGRLGFFSGLPRGVSLSAAEHPAGWVLRESSTYPGFGLASGDVDDDGRPEIVVGSHTAAAGAGRVWLLDGGPEGISNIGDVAAASFTGQPGEGVGYSLAVGPAILVGAPVSGGLHVLDANLQSVAKASGSELGRWVGWLPDLDGDGVAEAGVVDSAASGNRTHQGAAWVLSGADVAAGELGALQDTVQPGDADGDGVPVDQDCDDADPRRAPTLEEVCGDGLDNDCDGLQDEADCTRGGGCAVGVPAGGSLLKLAVLGVFALGLRRRREL